MSQYESRQTAQEGGGGPYAAGDEALAPFNLPPASKVWGEPLVGKATEMCDRAGLSTERERRVWVRILAAFVPFQFPGMWVGLTFEWWGAGRQR